MRFRETVNTIGLCGDGDDVDFLEALEAVFQIEILPEEAETLYNIGDVEDLIARKIPRDGSTSCLLRAMFRRLSVVLPAGTKPSDPLSDLSGDDLAGFCHTVSQKTGLTLDSDIRLRSIMNIWPETWVALPLLALYAWALFEGSWALAIVATIHLILSLWLGDEVADLLPHKKEPSQYLNRLDDLIRANLLNNYRDQTQVGSIANRGDQRAIIRGVGRQMTGYEGPIGRDTRLI